MSAMHEPGLDAISDDALMERLFELTVSGVQDSGEAAQIEAAVYVRLARTYGETIPQSQEPLAA